MKLSLFGRSALALFATLILGLGMTGCGGGTIAFMWVLGQQYNQIAAFKVDDFTGNLTQTPHQPFSSNGSKPVHLVVRSGGRYVYVLNQGTLPATCTTEATCQQHWTDGNVSVFSVGGDGVLTFQQSYVTQGYKGRWMQFDSTGSFLYVLDQYSPSGDGNGSITAYSVDSSTGRLFLVQNTQSVANGSTALTYFEVGSSTLPIPAPFMMRSTGTCLFTTNSNTVLPYTFSNGQLVVATNGALKLTSGSVTSIGGNGTLLSITDNVANNVALYTIASNCALTAVNGGTYDLGTNQGTANPQYSIIDSSGKYLYVLNQSTTRTLPTIAYSSIMAFTINQTNNQLQAIAGAPYPVGANPNCMVEDPTNQYIYTSDHDAGTVTGRVIDTTTGILSNLSRGSTFSATGQAQCLAISGATD